MDDHGRRPGLGRAFVQEAAAQGDRVIAAVRKNLEEQIRKIDSYSKESAQTAFENQSVYSWDPILWALRL